MVDTEKYIIIEKRKYNTREDARKKIQECYSKLLGVLIIPDRGK